MVTAFNMQDPDEVLLILLERMDAGGTFFMTDRPWDGSKFLNSTGDGTLKVFSTVLVIQSLSGMFKLTLSLRCRVWLRSLLC